MSARAKSASGALLDNQLVAESKIIKNDVVFAPGYEPERHVDELGNGFQVVSSRLFSYN